MALSNPESAADSTTRTVTLLEDLNEQLDAYSKLELNNETFRSRFEPHELQGLAKYSEKLAACMWLAAIIDTDAHMSPSTRQTADFQGQWSKVEKKLIEEMRRTEAAMKEYAGPMAEEPWHAMFSEVLQKCSETVNKDPDAAGDSSRSRWMSLFNNRSNRSDEGFAQRRSAMDTDCTFVPLLDLLITQQDWEEPSCSLMRLKHSLSQLRKLRLAQGTKSIVCSGTVTAGHTDPDTTSTREIDTARYHLQITKELSDHPELGSLYNYLCAEFSVHPICGKASVETSALKRTPS